MTLSLPLAIHWANNQYDILLNDWKGKATGITKAGAQYFSRDGIHYTLMSKEPVFTKTVLYDDKTSETFSRRERPFVLTNEKQEVIALFTACLPTNGPARIVVQRDFTGYRTGWLSKKARFHWVLTGSRLQNPIPIPSAPLTTS
jgi:hypothetical protein